MKSIFTKQQKVKKYGEWRINMRRIILYALFLALVTFSLISCSTQSDEGENSVNEMSSVQATEVPVTAEPTPTPEPSFWEVAYYVDDFGDETDESYVRGIFEGHFSNTATFNSNLSVVIYVSKPYSQYNISFRLLEYNNSVATYYDDDSMYISFKINDIIYTGGLDGVAPNGDLILDMHGDGLSKLMETLIESPETEISCFVEIENSKYNFDFNGLGIESAIETFD